MKAFTQLDGLVAPMDRANVDTDLIIPKQFLKSIKRSGFGPNLFDELRYLDEGKPDADCSQRPLNPDFPLNFPRYQGASILLARENFGCGSSREHAPWALEGFGIRAVSPALPSSVPTALRTGFCPSLCPLPVTGYSVRCMPKGYRLTVDLEQQVINTPAGDAIGFEVDAFRRDCLLKGLDDIGITLQSEGAIRAFETGHRERFPWVFKTLEVDVTQVLLLPGTVSGPRLLPRRDGCWTP